MEVESSAKESQASSTEAVKQPPSEDGGTNMEDAGATPNPSDAGSTATTESEPPKKDSYGGKYTWDMSPFKTKEKAVVTLPSGVISDYAWADGKKSVSIYITLPGLDTVASEDMSVKLINKDSGLLFEVANLQGKKRFLSIKELSKKPKSVKFVRKMGRDQVVIKVFKENEKQKWYSLKTGGYSGGYEDYDDYNFDDDDDADLETPPLDDKEGEEDVSTDKKEDATGEVEAMNEDTTPTATDESEKKDEDVPMEATEDK